MSRYKEKAEHKQANLLVPFETLNHYLIRSRSPKASDFTEGLIYYPEKYLSEMKSKLEEKRRVLLVGSWAVGKTVLAIVLAKQLQEAENYKVFYLDISEEQVINGQAWYQVVHTNDRKGNLYILDNCHLAPEEISEFCAYWNVEPLKHTQCILISRSRTKTLDMLSLEESDDYFKMWADETVEVQPVELFRGILEKYAVAYRRKDPDHYVALEEDDEVTLRTQHADNLVMSRIRLEAWQEIGGRLSELTQEAVYKSLCEKYLESKKIGKIREALLTLCALWQYEIPAQGDFVESALAKHEVKVRHMEKEKLLTHLVVSGYGTLYQLMLHPIEAQEIFRAGIYREYGSVNDNLIEAKTIQALRTYLLTQPRNYSLVYYRLYHQEQITLQQRLLQETDLQVCAQNQFEEGEMFEVAQYLYGLSRVDSARAQQLLLALVQQSGMQKIRLRMLKGNFLHIGLSLLFIQRIEMQFAREMVAEIDMKQLSQRIQTESFQLYWLFLLALKKISPAQAKVFLENIPASVLTSQLTSSMVLSVRSIIYLLQELEVSSTQAVVEALDMKQLAKRAQTQSLQQLYWFLKTLKATSQAGVSLFLNIITPIDMVFLCSSKKATIKEISDLLTVMPKNLRRQFLQYFSPEEIAEIFGRSHLHHVGSFLQYHYRYLKEGYVLFREQLLASKLASSSLQEIGKFIYRIGQIPEEGTKLANEAFGLLITIDLPDKLSSTDPHQPKKLYDVLEKSDLHDIQFFLGGMAGIDAQYLQFIRQCLEASKNLVDKLALADVGDIGYFLWNVYAVIDKDLAQAYCKLVDAQDRSNVLGNISLESLCRFVWNLIHISDLPRLQTLDNPKVTKRLQEAWQEHIGLGMALLGTLSITRPTIARELQLPPIETQTEQLGIWLMQLSEGQSPHPHILALTLQGLRSYDELEAQAIVHASLDLSKASYLLEDALAEPIVTPRSMVLLREIHAWLGKLLTNPSANPYE